MMPRALLLTAALGLACATSRTLPGTEIKDTDDARAIAALLESYRQAMERGDGGAVLDMAASDYLDNSGTSDPADDIDRDGLAKRLDELSRVSGLQLRLTVRRIDVEGAKAHADVFFDQWYKVATAGGAVPRHDSDIHRMLLEKQGGAWKFQSGL
jgi:thiamine monophosphate kinase